jgi:hypothetical protein
MDADLLGRAFGPKPWAAASRSSSLLRADKSAPIEWHHDALTTRQAIALAFILLVLAAVFAVLTVDVFGRN